MNNYEVTFIVDPVLSGDEIKLTAQAYEKLLRDERAELVFTDEMGLKQLAYPINKRSSGVYYSLEFKSENHAIIPRLELALRRDERVMRFLSIKLDKYGVKYNEDKRNGLIGKKRSSDKKAKPAPAAKKAAPAAKPAPSEKPAPAPVATKAASEEE